MLICRINCFDSASKPTTDIKPAMDSCILGQHDELIKANMMSNLPGHSCSKNNYVVSECFVKISNANTLHLKYANIFC